MLGLETVYQSHHKRRGDGFAILLQERGDFLRKHIGTGKKILDIGCRDGQLTKEYMAGNTVTGADIDSEALERARALGVESVHLDLNDAWPFAPNSFDAVVACEFLEHIYFPAVVFEKIEAALRPGGILVGTVPHAYSLQSRIKFLLGIKRGTPLEDPTHINHFTFREFKGLLSARFELVELTGHVPPRYKLVAKLFPTLFIHDMMFCAKKKTKE
ncbi:MAG: class I SAM-dependent methyltransferase [Candidatus Pacebacteria bacterium]|jgi:SAM-dependent methyltransferase|nr:class I SAM-dependent methyltransferase [Candidatus Paceibacterota bacterium]